MVSPHKKSRHLQQLLLYSDGFLSGWAGLFTMKVIVQAIFSNSSQRNGQFLLISDHIYRRRQGKGD